ncbi:FAD-dependent monooxygenase [Rhizobium panacihumi]|uniref:FAD-dependent monooxygenase n=1 Tax=Rhizobium panacihumi TaxID=2008450 RepID=UPI003D7A3402
MNTQTSHYDVEVIIVGAGPIGLATGCALRHHDVDCLILEERTEMREYSRANNLWARPQELLQSIGVRDALAENAYGIDTINFFVNGVPTTPTAIADVDSPFPTVLYSSQEVIEGTLARIFERRGGRLEHGCKVVDINDDGEGVTVTFTRHDSAEKETRRCRYLVAADGAHSTVRPLLDLDFEPKKLENCLSRQVDAKLTWRRSGEPEQLWFFYYERGFCGVMPVWDGYHRVFFLSDDESVPERDPTLEEIQAVAREVVGDETLTLSDPQWLSHSRYQYGVSAGYMRGRVLLAGDAGHLSLPIGGQGMNAGLHDAVEVAWRLAMTLRGEATPLVLDSYVERGDEHIRLSTQQVKGFKRTIYRGSITDAVLSIAAKIVPNIGSLMQGTDDMQQLSVSYPNSLLNSDHLAGLAHLLHKGPKPGDRAPDAEVVVDGNTTNLLSYLYNPDGRTTGWALLCFDGRTGDADRLIFPVIQAVASWTLVRPRLVLAGPIFAAGEAPVLSDLDGKAHGTYGMEGQPALILVRPDGHIAFRASAESSDELVTYCARVFGPRT